MRQRLIALSLLLLPLAAAAQTGCSTPTPADTEGPFYKAGAPTRASLLEPDARGERLVLDGRVLGADCKPVPGALLDFWQADDRGEYDNAGFRYRGKVTADAEGRYRIETILPAEYPGRPRHIHVKVQRPGGRTLTTQLYFPGESRRENPALVLRTERSARELRGSYDFVLR
jgi:protocatechuate 3,4-dioxygenase beta subunit